MKDLRELNHYRDRNSQYSAAGGLTHPGMDRYAGFFRIPVAGSKRPLCVIASAGDGPGTHGWDHVSVSLPSRCPRWEEMDLVKRLFFHPHEVAMQLHPPESDHISNHPYCLHIWRPIAGEIPLPPSILVGVGSMGQLDKDSSRQFLRALQSVGAL